MESKKAELQMDPLISQRNDSDNYCNEKSEAIVESETIKESIVVRASKAESKTEKPPQRAKTGYEISDQIPYVTITGFDGVSMKVSKEEMYCVLG